MITAWFWGGPLDGQTRTLQRYHPEFLVPMPEKLTSVGSWGVRLMPIRVGVYRAELKLESPTVIFTWKGAE